MIEGGGLGDGSTPTTSAPPRSSRRNGVIDVARSRRGRGGRGHRSASSPSSRAALESLTEPDQARASETPVPERRRRAYDVEPRGRGARGRGVGGRPPATRFAPGMVTALARIEGRPLGIDRQQPDAPRRGDHQRRRRQGRPLHAALRRLRAADHLADRHPGDDGRPRRRGDRASFAIALASSSRALSLRVPSVAVILRKAYGLGAQAMAGGSLHEPLLTVGWPTSELGPMGLEGAVRLGLRRELEAIEDPDEREARVQDADRAGPREREGPQRGDPVRARRRDRSRRDPIGDRRDPRGGRQARERAPRAASSTPGDRKCERLLTLACKCLLRSMLESAISLRAARNARPTPARKRAK